MNRRHFVRSCIALSSSVTLGRHAFGAQPAPLVRRIGKGAGGRRPPNILFITADDMSYDSLGCTGSRLPGISPNLDRLAGEGLLLDHCHVATPVCGPSRTAWITGTWPQHNGMMGHYNQPPRWFGRSPITNSLPELLRSEGSYYTGLVCKNPLLVPHIHGAPHAPAPNRWDYEAAELHTGLCRDPSKYEDITATFIEHASRQDRPFFLHSNSSDPHEYWAGQKHETKAWIDAMMGGRQYATYANGKPYPDPDITYTKDQIPVPPSWPDNEAIREDIHTYYNSVRRLDQTVGGMMRALQATGQEENTLVVFLSDNGMGRAFAKWSLYPLGTRTPMIVRWPGVVAPGRHDRTSVVSAIDVAPTFLEAAGVAIPTFMDARSLMDIIRNTGRGEARDKVFTCFNYMNNYPEQDAKYPVYTRDLADRFDNYRPMRAVHSTRYTYIWNGWADGRNQIPLEMSASQTIRRILRETGHEDRARFEAYRTRQEFYDTVNDPGCLVNLIDEPALADTVAEFRTALLQIMERTNDQETPNYRSLAHR